MLNLTNLYLNIFQISLTTLMQLNPVGEQLPAIAVKLSSLETTPHTLELAKGEPYQSTYERENVGENDQDEELEEIRREDYQQRDRYERDDYSSSEDEYSQYRYRREVLEERKQEIERQIEELDRQYGY